MSPDPNEPIERILDDVASASELDEAWAGVRGKRAARARGRERLRLALAVGAIACVAVVAAWVTRGGEPATARRVPAVVLERSDGAGFDHVGSGETIVLSDRSRIVTSDASELDVLENAADVLSLHLVRGRARFEVTPGGPRDWVVEAAGVSVEVVGTVFEVDRGEATLRVRVERGVVVVRGASVHDGVRRLTAGDELVVDIRSDAVPEATEPALPEVVSQAPEARERPRTERAARPRDAATLLREADALRREGRQDEAIDALIAVVNTHPSTPEAGIAAFTTARLMHERGREADARHWYGRALELGLPDALADDARAALADPTGAPAPEEAPAP